MNIDGDRAPPHKKGDPRKKSLGPDQISKGDSSDNMFIFKDPLSSPQKSDAESRPDAQTVTTKVVSVKDSDINDPKSEPGVDDLSPKKVKVKDQVEMGFEPILDDDELHTDRQEFYNLDSDRKLRADNDYTEHKVIEMKSFARNTVNSLKKSIDTRATDFKDGIVLPDVSQYDDEDDEEEESLIGVQDNSAIIE